MSTRALIARTTSDGGWEARYHHWDGYPEGLGATLYDLFNGHFEQDAKAMLHILLDEHPGGWSNIIDADFNEAPGFGASPGPQCYCHGERSEGPFNFITDEGPDYAGAEYCYIINTHDSVMTARKYAYRSSGWKTLAVVPLLGPEPAWDKMT